MGTNTSFMLLQPVEYSTAYSTERSVVCKLLSLGHLHLHTGYTIGGGFELLLSWLEVDIPHRAHLWVLPTDVKGRKYFLRGKHCCFATLHYVCACVYVCVCVCVCVCVWCMCTYVHVCVCCVCVVEVRSTITVSATNNVQWWVQQSVQYADIRTWW